MSTGLETWVQNLLEVGPLYPFAGSEMLLAILAIGSWIVWHIIQICSEAKVIKHEKALFSDKKRLKAAMDMSDSDSLVGSVKNGFDT